MALNQSTVGKFYSSVIDDVIGAVRESFLDEGVDEQVLMELRSIWEQRLLATKAVEPAPQPEPPQPPPPPVKPTNRQSTSTNHIPQVSNTLSNIQLPPDYASKNVSIQISLPVQQGDTSNERRITIQVPTSAIQGNQLEQVLSGPVISATMALPHAYADTLLQQHVTAALQAQASNVNQANGVNNRQNDSTLRQNGPQQTGGMVQLDGTNDTSDDDDENDDDDIDDDDDDDADVKDDIDNDDGGVEEEPLNSGDDVSEEDPTDMFETDNVVVCQYDKITRSRNKWKFYLKDGIMNLSGKDYVFQKSNGDAEW